jgi:hypothetical protein
MSDDSSKDIVIQINKRKTIGKLIGFFVISTLFVTVILLVQEFLTPEPSFDKIMLKSVNEINKNCPIQVDKITRLDNVMTHPDNVFQFNYTLINKVKDSVDVEKYRNYIKPITLNKIVSDTEFNFCRRHKTTFSYCYYDKNGTFIFKFEITPKDYESVK